MAQTCLPPGFRFHPTDVELVSYYLKRKIMGKKLFVEAISEVELYKFAPWDLPDKSCLQSKDLEWFFFCPRDLKYPKGSRTNRATPNGYWKTSGKDRTIELNSRIVGLKKTLIFHEGKAPKGDRTDWVMYEYKMEDDTLVSAGFSKDAYVLCKIFKKSGLGPRIGEQYGAPFDENEWENLEAGTSVFAFAPLSVVQEPQVESSTLATATVVQEPQVESSTLATATVIQEPPVPSQQLVPFSDDVNFSSNEANDAAPEIDGILLDELTMFLNDSPRHDISFAENSGLPPISEFEAQALEMNTFDLYNELAGLAHAGSASNVDFPASNDGVTENNLEQTYPELNTSDDYLELDDLLPGETFSYGLANDQFSQYPFDLSAYNSQYDYGAVPSAFDASGSLPPLPAFDASGSLPPLPAFDASVSLPPLPAFDASVSLPPLPIIFDDMASAPKTLVNPAMDTFS